MVTPKVITRFAPSPTGLFHAGSYRTALFAYIFARQNNGKFILRIEDTDKERSKKEYEDNILASLKWLGMEYDEIYRQSERTEIYKKYIAKLIESGHAYVSKETPKEEGERTEVIRFKNPNKKVVFEDVIRGQIEFDTTELNDFVIAKSTDEPVFHLVNVVDDIEMGMTHIIRGEDHISNTPRQILIYEALGATLPKFAHIPLLLSTDRAKLSKRHGAQPVSAYKSMGYLGEAIVNYMALLGWHPTDDREVLSLDEIIKEFSLERVQKSGAIFDGEKLKWFNRQYIQKLDDAKFAVRAQLFVPEWLSTSSSLFKKLVPLLREKITTFEDISSLFKPEGELGFISKVHPYNVEQLLWKKNPSREAAKKHLEAILKILASSNNEVFESDSLKSGSEAIKAAVWPYVEASGKGDVLWPLRMALTGQDKSPDPFAAAYILGKEESLNRISASIKLLSISDVD